MALMKWMSQSIDLNRYHETTSLSLPKIIIGSTLVQFWPLSLCHATLEGEGGGGGREREREEGGGQNCTRSTPVTHIGDDPICADPGFVNGQSWMGFLSLNLGC